MYSAVYSIIAFSLQPPNKYVTLDKCKYKSIQAISCLHKGAKQEHTHRHKSYYTFHSTYTLPTESTVKTDLLWCFLLQPKAICFLLLMFSIAAAYGATMLLCTM